MLVNSPLHPNSHHDDLLQHCLDQGKGYQTIQSALDALKNLFQSPSDSKKPPRKWVPPIQCDLKPLKLNDSQEKLVKKQIPTLMAYILYAYKKSLDPVKIVTQKKNQTLPYSTQISLTDQDKTWKLKLPVKVLLIDLDGKFQGPKLVLINKNFDDYKIAYGGLHKIQLAFSPSGQPVILRKSRDREKNLEDGLQAYRDAQTLSDVKSALPSYGIAHYSSNDHERISLAMPKATQDFDQFLSQSTTLSWESKVKFAEEILNLLRNLFSHDQTHGDIKAKNLVFFDGHLKWIDFDKSNGDPLTTYLYAPPESAFHSYTATYKLSTDDYIPFLQDMKRRKATDIFMTGILFLYLFAQGDALSIALMHDLENTLESVSISWNKKLEVKEGQTSQWVQWDMYAKSDEWKQRSSEIDQMIKNRIAVILGPLSPSLYRDWHQRLSDMLAFKPEDRKLPDF